MAAPVPPRRGRFASGGRSGPAVLSVLLFFLLVTVALIPVSAAPEIEGVGLFPDSNIWNTPVDRLPVAVDSALYGATIGATKPLRADFGSGTWDGGPIGIPFTTVPGTQQKVAIEFEYADESDPGPYPIPPDVPREWGSDHHLLVLDRDNALLYEVYGAERQADGHWHAGSGAVFDLESNELRPQSWTSADAAGLPILPGLVRYDEVASGAITHALRFTAPETRRAFVWPARHYASSLVGSRYPAMGQRFRLKADYDLSGFSTEVRTILQALKTYGMILADNGSPWFLSGVPDARWDNDRLRELQRVPGSAFEAVDVSSLMVDPDSAEAGTGSPGSFPGHLPPGDADRDGLYEDVNGNGRSDFADIVLLFNHADLIAPSGWETFYDFNRNTRFDFADIVALFGRL